MTWIIVNIATEGVTVGTLPKAIIGREIEVLDTTKVGIVLDFTDGICTGGLDPEIDCTGEPDFIFLENDSVDSIVGGKDPDSW